ncbi:MAG: BolA family transcriptional regulator [Rickettsiales bacterium]|jgi:BolA protein|nr:BolA family transcriptional regulator [Rickettsiales bacterium]
MTAKERITHLVTETLHPLHLEVVDESYLHKGHAGYREGVQTHLRLTVVSTAFEGKSRVDRHRILHTLLDNELKNGVHALALVLHTPEEMQRSRP